MYKIVIAGPIFEEKQRGRGEQPHIVIDILS